MPWLREMSTCFGSLLWGVIERFYTALPLPPKTSKPHRSSDPLDDSSLDRCGNFGHGFPLGRHIETLACMCYNLVFVTEAARGVFLRLGPKNEGD